jgi:peptidyl-prolyl cis-trans isomerase D
MLASLRRFAATWPARVFFLVLCGSFGLWGVSGMLSGGLGGDPNTVATVGGRKISASELQDASRRMLAQYMRSSGSTAAPTPEIRRGIAEQAMQQLVIQAAFAVEVSRLHLAVPDDALRQQTFDTRAFQGPNGQFDRATFNSVLRNNGFTEARYLDLLRTDIGQRQLVEAVRAGGFSPDLMNRLVFTFQGETRTADLVSLPFAAAAEPPAPTDEQLEREYDDNSTAYTTPEMRRIKAVILSPEGVAKDIVVSDADAHAYYDSHQAEFGKPETRSVQVLVAPSEAIGRTLATSWMSGADWDAIQKQAAAAGASAVALDDTTAAAFPAPDLVRAVFDAPPNAVTGPVQEEGGWSVFKVTKLQTSDVQPFAAVEAEVKGRVALEQATDQVYDRANKVQDALAGGAKLDELPGGLGLQAVTGTLDAAGNTPAGTPAPIPAAPALRQALIAKAFAIAPSDQPTLEDGPDHSFYAVSVDSIIPPAQQPLDAVKDRVRDDWLRDTRKREQDLVATKLLTAVNGGASLKDAAAAAGVPMTRSPPIGRTTPPPGIPAELVQPLFATDTGHATMVESPTGFTVAVTVAINKPDPATNPAGMDRVRAQLGGSMSDDLEMTFAAALRDRDKVVVNRQLLDSVAQ